MTRRSRTPGGESECRFSILRFPSERGQASIEVFGLLPLILLLALVGMTVVASYSAHEQAGEAAAAGALALLQGGADPRAAALDALPKAARTRATITIKASKNVRFKAGKELKDALNKGR